VQDDPIFDFIFKHFSKIWLATVLFIISIWCVVGAFAVKIVPIAWNELDNLSQQQVELENK
jgi:predicted PurR-regulated permease PerM